MKTRTNRGYETREAMDYEDRASYPQIIEMSDDASADTDFNYAISAFTNDPERGKEVTN